MNIDEDGLSDEYDFVDDMDDDEENTGRHTRQQANQPTLKYMELLQNVANRKEDEVVIDLDDLAQVRFRVENNSPSVR